jgi:hypothetical protein
VVCGFRYAVEYNYTDSLCVFDVDGDLDVPLWTRRIDEDDAVPDPENKGLRGGHFQFFYGACCDVFDDSDHPGPEIVAAFVAGPGSACVVRIYDLTGDVLYQVWHRGTISGVYWMWRAKMLVFAGRHDDPAHAVRDAQLGHPMVIFGLRPEAGTIHDAYVRSGSGAGSVEPEWFKYLCPLMQRDKVTGYRLTQPAYSDDGRSAHFSFAFVEDPAAGVGWDIDEHGIRLGERQVTDAYENNQRNGNPKGLPDSGLFDLCSP